MMEEDILNYSPTVMFRGTPLENLPEFFFFNLMAPTTFRNVHFFFVGMHLSY